MKTSQKQKRTQTLTKTPTHEKTPKEKSIPVQEAIRATEATGTTQTAFSPDKDGKTLSGVPEVMCPTTHYFLYRTGRETFTQKDVEALKSVTETHTPACVQKEIDIDVEHFIGTHRNLTKITFAYIVKSLKDQKSYEKSVTGRKGASSKKASVGNKKAQNRTSNRRLQGALCERIHICPAGAPRTSRQNPRH